MKQHLLWYVLCFTRCQVQPFLGDVQSKFCFVGPRWCLRACLHGGGGPQVSEVTCGGLPHLSCKHEQIKMRDYMDRRVTPPKRVKEQRDGAAVRVLASHQCGGVQIPASTPYVG